MEHVEYVVDDRAPARPPVASFTVAEPEPRDLTVGERLSTAPGWAFHVASGLGALGVVWAASAPAGLSARNPFAWLGIACLLAWAVRMGFAASRRALTTAFLGVPLIAAVLAAGVYLEIPQETRWMQAQGGFEKALRAMPTAKHWDQTVADEVTPGRIGAYWIESVSRDGAGMVQFHLGNGVLGVAGDSGSAFTYLVEGPTEEVRAANPGATFSHLHGNWYVVRN
jgi:hypothetical protein